MPTLIFAKWSAGIAKSTSSSFLVIIINRFGLLNSYLKILVNIILLFAGFSHLRWLDVFRWSLSDCKSPQVFRTLLSFLADPVDWMVSARFLIYNSSSILIKPLDIVPSVPATSDIPVTLTFHSLFSSLARSKYLSLFSSSYIFTVVRWDGKVRYLAGSLFWWLSLGLIIKPKLGDLFVSENQRQFCASRSSGRILGCVYITCSCSQIYFSYTKPCGPPSPPSGIYRHILFLH